MYGRTDSEAIMALIKARITHTTYCVRTRRQEIMVGYNGEAHAKILIDGSQGRMAFGDYKLGHPRNPLDGSVVTDIDCVELYSIKPHKSMTATPEQPKAWKQPNSDYDKWT